MRQEAGRELADAAARAEDERPVAVSTDGRALSQRGERTREALLAAAEEVFGDLDYHGASIVKITQAAGVAQGTFYRYFTSKEAVFDELVTDLNSRVRRAMSEGAERGRTRAEAERYGFEAYFRFTEAHPKLYRIIRQAEMVSPEILKRHYERIAEGYVAGLERAMDAGEVRRADPEVLAYALMGVGEMIGMRWILWGDGIPSEVVDEVQAFITQGLGARSDS